MTIYINAWIDCRQPHISIHNKKTGEKLAYFSPIEVDKLFADGEITIEELQSRDPVIQQELVKELFLYRAIQDIGQQVYDLPKTLKQRKPVFSLPSMATVIPDIHTLNPPSISIFPSHADLDKPAVYIR